MQWIDKEHILCECILWKVILLQYIEFCQFITKHTTFCRLFASFASVVIKLLTSTCCVLITLVHTFISEFNGNDLSGRDARDSDVNQRLVWSDEGILHYSNYDYYYCTRRDRTQPTLLYVTRASSLFSFVSVISQVCVEGRPNRFAPRWLAARLFSAPPPEINELSVRARRLPWSEEMIAVDRYSEKLLSILVVRPVWIRVRDEASLICCFSWLMINRKNKKRPMVSVFRNSSLYGSTKPVQTY